MNWFESHEALQENGERMLTLPEFREVLKYCKFENPTNDCLKLYNDITELRNPWRAEWLDADFKVKDGILYVNSKHILENGKLAPKYSKPLTKNTLMQDKRISLEHWIKGIKAGSTAQGFPNKKIQEGDLNYTSPRSDNNSVASFDAASVRRDLYCYWLPSGRGSGIGYLLRSNTSNVLLAKLS